MRESLFLNLNYILVNKYGWSDDDPRTPDILMFLHEYSYTTLYYSKWFLTGAFAVLFSSITLIAIWLVYREKKYLKWTLIFFGILLFLAILSFGLGWSLQGFGTSFYAKGYRLSQNIMRFLQSPLPLLLLLPAFRLAKQRPS